MNDYKKRSHAVWDCKYHLVWITKYRYPVLLGNEPGTVGHRARELLREIAHSMELTIYVGAINREHVHMLISTPPHVSVSRTVQFSKEQEFAQVIERVSEPSETVLESASLGARVLGRIERECHR